MSRRPKRATRLADMALGSPVVPLTAHGDTPLRDKLAAAPATRTRPLRTTNLRDRL
jgi:hypothetical protein